MQVRNVVNNYDSKTNRKKKKTKNEIIINIDYNNARL